MTRSYYDALPRDGDARLAESHHPPEWCACGTMNVPYSTTRELSSTIAMTDGWSAEGQEKSGTATGIVH